ncbi:MAG: glycerol-3-phosphate 1-O-acyltransferase PlsY [Armatimonadetes bacterium]|nr:glycerol-3-phosphate 1-O-acyltransferase PlsY [Armatimonadota bacterium]
MMIALIAIGAYLLGSLPFGKWIAAARGIDIMREGSKSIGATNVWRTLGWKAGLAVFLLDAAKGFIAATAGGMIPRLFENNSTFSHELALLMGASAVLGHSASIFLGFKGGKSVAAALGVLLSISPEVAGLSLLVFLIVFGICRYVSVGSLCGVVSAPIFAAAFHYSWVIVLAYAVLAALIVYRHRANINRLMKGEEYKFSKQSSTTEAHGP